MLRQLQLKVLGDRNSPSNSRGPTDSRSFGDCSGPSHSRGLVDHSGPSHTRDFGDRRGPSDSRDRGVGGDPSDGGDSSDGGDPDDVRSLASSRGTNMLDTQRGSRYSDVELKENTNKLLGKEVLLPKLTDVKEEFEKWRSELTLRFPLYKLDEITCGDVDYDAQLEFVNPHYHRWFDTCRVMAFTAMALPLDTNLRELFKVDELTDQMKAPSLLWGRLTAHFTKGDGINPDYILRDLLNRELMPGETVDQYVAASEELVRRFRQASGEIDEWEHARLLISNSQRVFRELADQQTVWSSTNDRRTLTRFDATRRLRQSEQSRMQVASLQPASSSVPRAAQVSHITQHQNRKEGKKKRRGAKHGEEVQQKKALTKCSNCQPLKPELADKFKSKGKQPATSFVGAIGVAPSDKIVQHTTVIVSPVYSPTTPASSDGSAVRHEQGIEQRCDVGQRGDMHTAYAVHHNQDYNAKRDSGGPFHEPRYAQGGLRVGPPHTGHYQYGSFAENRDRLYSYRREDTRLNCVDGHQSVDLVETSVVDVAHDACLQQEDLRNNFSLCCIMGHRVLPIGTANRQEDAVTLHGAQRAASLHHAFVTSGVTAVPVEEIQEW